MGTNSAWVSWSILAAVFLAVILVPFFLFEESILAWVQRLIRPELHAGPIAVAVITLLALDVFLPVPSSIVSTAAGATLGLLPGFAASTLGMSIGSWLGYVCGRRFGLPIIRRIVREQELAVVSARFRRGSAWTIAAMRPIPVLAEASAMFAGVSRVPLPAFLIISTLANAGISAVYCAVGASALEKGSFLLAFAGSIALPGVAMLIDRMRRKIG